MDEDLRTLRRYIAFHEDNLETFSLELHRIIQMAALEVEAVLLSLCRGISGRCGGKRSPSFMNSEPFGAKISSEQKWGIRVEDIVVHFPGLGVKPLDPQSQQVYPWWDAYTSLKHGRTQAREEGHPPPRLDGRGSSGDLVDPGVSEVCQAVRTPTLFLKRCSEWCTTRLLLGEPAHVYTDPPYEVWYVASP